MKTLSTGRRTFTAVVSMLALVSVAAFGGTPQDAPGEKLRVLNWNILYSFNHKRASAAGTRWISDNKPDVVALQELNGNDDRSLAAMAKKWGHKHSAILKKNGFPVGLTSREPIQVFERRVKGFHHGYLHCRTHGVHFFVVHFWPKKDHEAKVILEKVRALLAAKQRVIVLGDFNTHSRKDAEFLKSRNSVKPLYDVVDLFESHKFVDLVHKHSPSIKYSCPSPITIPKWSASMEVVKSKRQRIDFVFASEELARTSRSATIVRSKELDKISDHYPVLVEFERPKVARSACTAED